MKHQEDLLPAVPRRRWFRPSQTLPLCMAWPLSYWHAAVSCNTEKLVILSQWPPYYDLTPKTCEDYDSSHSHWKLAFPSFFTGKQEYRLEVRMLLRWIQMWRASQSQVLYKMARWCIESHRSSPFVDFSLSLVTNDSQVQGASSSSAHDDKRHGSIRALSPFEHTEISKIHIMAIVCQGQPWLSISRKCLRR